MSYYPCVHKSINGHSVLRDGKRIWTCSFCGEKGPWAEGWNYHGTIECKICWGPEIDEVRCPKCPPPKEAA